MYSKILCKYGLSFRAGNRGNCTQGCNNVIGSYSCFCGNGYTLNSDARSCDNINECASNVTNKCYSNSYCNDTDGTYNCSCPEGFRLMVTFYSYFCFSVKETMPVAADLISSFFIGDRSNSLW